EVRFGIQRLPHAHDGGAQAHEELVPLEAREERAAPGGRRYGPTRHWLPPFSGGRATRLPSALRCPPRESRRGGGAQAHRGERLRVLLAHSSALSNASPRGTGGVRLPRILTAARGTGRTPPKEAL